MGLRVDIHVSILWEIRRMPEHHVWREGWSFPRLWCKVPEWHAPSMWTTGKNRERHSSFQQTLQYLAPIVHAARVVQVSKQLEHENHTESHFVVLWRACIIPGSVDLEPIRRTKWFTPGATVTAIFVSANYHCELLPLNLRLSSILDILVVYYTSRPSNTTYYMFNKRKPLLNVVATNMSITVCWSPSGWKQIITYWSQRYKNACFSHMNVSRSTVF